MNIGRSTSGKRGMTGALLAALLGFAAVPVLGLEYEGLSDEQWSTAQQRSSSCVSQIELWQGNLRVLENIHIRGLEKDLANNGITGEYRTRRQQKLRAALALKASLEAKITALSVTCERLARDEASEQQKQQAARESQRREAEETRRREREEQAAAARERRVDQQREQAAERQHRQVDASTRKRETVNDVFKDFQDRQEQNRRDARDRQFEKNERQLREAVRRAETEPDEEWEKLIRPDAEQQRAAALQQQQLQAAYARQEAQRRQDELNRRTQEEYDSKLAAARAARLAEEQRLANLPPQPLLDEPLSDLLPDGPGSLTEAVEFAGRVISESAARLADALVAQVAGGEFPDLSAAARSAAGGAAAGLPRDLTRGLLESAAENSPPDVAAQYRALRYVDQLSEFNETFQRREFHALPGVFSEVVRTWNEFVDGALRPIRDFNP